MTGKRWNLWRQTERNSELCKLIERKPGKVNEIPLKVNETTGNRSREKTRENEKNGRRKNRVTVMRSEFQSEKCEEKAGFLQIPRIFT